MKPRLLTFFLFSWSIASSQSAGSDTTGFARFIGALPSLQLPLTLYCGVTQVAPGLPKPLPPFDQGFEVVGRLPARFGYLPVLYYSVGDIRYPTLALHRPDGALIAQIALGHGCGSDAFGSVSTFTAIDRSLRVVVVDSTTRWTVVPDRSEPRTDSIGIRRREYSLTRAGQFLLRMDSTRAVVPAQHRRGR
jgi:hypothetical protein